PKDTGIIYLDKGGFISETGEARLPVAMPPRQVEAMDRSQRWLLEASGQALGGADGTPGRTSVFVGHAPKCENEVAAEFRVLQADLTRLLSESLAEAGVPAEARADMLSAAEAHALADLPAPSEDTLPGYQGCFHAGRVSAALGGTGPGVAVDSACASSLAALELACRALREGECDRAVVGGTWANLSAEYYNMFSLFQALCKGERQDALGPEASGFIPGEGAGALVLKRLEDAVREGDPIHAVVRAVAGSSDGRGKALYAVNPKGLLDAVQRAVATAGVSPDSVSLVEAHATASPAGDVAELEAYSSVYGQTRPVALSFLKGNVGHLNTAAGIAALVKTALALEHGRVLPAAGFTRLHPDATLGDSKLHVATEETALPEGECRRAAVTSYGMGGTNYHAILDAPPAPARAPSVRSAAGTDEELVAVVGADAYFASGAGLEDFWEGAVAGRGGLRELPAERWKAVDYALDGSSRAPRGGFLDGAALEFPWQKFRVPPLQARRMPPMDRLLFRTIHRALEHAGYGDVSRLPRTDTAILVGSMGPMMDPTVPELLGFRAHEVMEALESADAVRGLSGDKREAFLARVRELLTPRKADTAGDVSGSASIMAGRISNLLGLKGMHLGVDAEAASALVALDVAARGLLQGDFDVALVAALSPWLSPLVLEAYRQLVPDAPGFHLGEGGGAVVLKRLSDARRDGDRVLGVIRATGTASHGRSQLPTSPSADTLARAMREALERARWEPGSVGYLEGHACGVPEWDGVEREAVGRVFGEAVRCGSAKEAAGHTLSAAGMAGFLRALLAVERGRLPARVGGTAGEWPQGPRRAGVTAWGLNGMACHVLLEEAPAESAWAPRPRPERRPLDVALVGLGGVFPQAPDVPTLWQNLLERRPAMGEVPAERWAPEPYFDASPTTPGRIYSRLGAFVKQLPERARLKGLPPAARERMDRSQGMAVAAAREALGGRTLGVEEGRVGVVLADMDWRANEVSPTLWLALLGLRRRLAGTLVELGLTHDAALEAVGQAVERFQARHAPITEDTLPGYLGSMAAGRVAHDAGAAGPSFVVESTCASSLASLYVAANLLRTGRCDVVLSGGVFANLTPEYYLVNCSFRALSATGIRPFDARADGFVPGEGAGVLVLKRLEDAERDGDTIHAVVRGIGGSSDGGGTILAPNASGQALAVRRALEQARWPGDSVRYVECHGAGTALGDLTELDAYAEAYGERERPLGLTSIKSAIGHLASAAGVSGVIKTALALRNGVLPPSLGFERPNDSPHLASGRFAVLTEAKPWEDGGVRRAGVSGFGLGGTNFHVVLEEYRARPEAARAQPPVPPEAPTAPVPRAPARAEDGARLSPARLAALLVQGARQQFPGRAVWALEDLRLMDVEPGGAAPVVEVEPVPESEDPNLRVPVRVVDAGRREHVLALGQVVMEKQERVKEAGASGAWSVEDLERVLGAAAPSATGEWRLLGVGRLAPSTEAPSLHGLRLGREVRVQAVVDSPRVRVEEARWWSPPPRWRATRFLEDGRLSHPSDSPLVDRRLSAGEASLEVLREVSLAREPYLEDHRLDGIPVVPGAVHVEALT
ncbi:MAG TPA: beta-ketoacyl synthase N-terminal-like domain-containing protein, partial [Myxococcus sp.]|nr:beta-ketoacyl synthase N-terminal-like domain-containing protein [Myxococcus sp.]